MRIDAHIHYTPPSLKEDLEAYNEREPFWGLCITPDPVNQTEQGWATPERMIEDMDKAGLDKVVLLAESQMTEEETIERNNVGIEIMRRYPDRVIAFANIQPKTGKRAIEELKRCIDNGMLGVGETDPYGENFRLDDPDFLRFAEACNEYDVPINFHMTEEFGHFYIGKSAVPIRDYHQLASRLPELKIILAHWGGGLIFYEIMPEVRQAMKNVWYDMASSPLLFPTEPIFRVALQCVSHKKILYGSDYPYLIVPDKQKEPDFRPFLRQIDDLNLQKDIYDDIMGDNTARLLGLMEKEDSQDDYPYPVYSGQSKIITEIKDKEGVRVSEYMAIRAVAEAFPASRPVFEKYNIAWKDSPVPFWEPIAQAAAARGMGPKARRKLINEINEAIS